MAKYIQQFRYYGDGNSKNFPSGATAEDFANGKIFSSYCPIVQLGIQTRPFTSFYVNENTYKITIGATGIYELDLQDLIHIDHLSINSVDLAAINKSNGKEYLIIDIIYEKEN